MEESVANGYYVVIYLTDGGVHFVSDNAKYLTSAIKTEMDRLSPENPKDFTMWRDGNAEYAHRTPSRNFIVCGREASAVDAKLTELRNTLIFIGMVILGLGAAGGWVMAGRSLRTSRRISAAASEINAGRTDQRIGAGTAKSELGELAKTLNHSFDQLSELS